MRVSWMALLCAVFVSLFPLPVDASEEVCVTCHITLDLPAIVPSLTCVHSSFELLESAEICYCAVKVTISNECSEELTVYKQASSTAIQCTENNSDECETLPVGGNTEVLFAIPYDSSIFIAQNIVFMKYDGEFHWLIFETTSRSSSSHAAGCGGMVSPGENSLQSEMFLILQAFLVASLVKRRVRE